MSWQATLFAQDWDANGIYNPYSFALTLSFYIPLQHLKRCASYSEQTKTPTPKRFLPQPIPYLRELFLDKPAARAFVCVDEFTYHAVRVSAEKNMDMI
jgi:hypothetical protein